MSELVNNKLYNSHLHCLIFLTLNCALCGDAIFFIFYPLRMMFSEPLKSIYSALLPHSYISIFKS